MENNRSSFWASHRSAVTALVLFLLTALLIGCGGGGGGGGTGGPGGGTGGIPNAPQNLQASPGNGQVFLTWQAPPQGSSLTYIVLRSTSQTTGFVQIISALTATNYTDNGVTNDVTYFYKVRAQNINGTSGDSNTASTTPTAGGGTGGSWLDPNKIFYTAADNVDPLGTDLREVDPDGNNDVQFASWDMHVIAASPNPNVANQFVFAYTSDNVLSSSTVYALYRNTAVTPVGAVKLTDEGTNGFNSVGSILFTLDGQKILFTASIGNDHGLYVMNPNGTALLRLTTADDASLSPDGNKILISQPQGGQNDLFTLNVSDIGAANPPLTPIQSTTGEDEIMPQWSKNGSKIVFSAESTSDATPNFEIFEVSAGGGSPTQLTANGDDNFSPSVSADNTTVAYSRVSGTDPNTSGIYTAPIGGGSESNVLFNSSVGTSVYWTSDTGRSIGSASFSLSHTLHTLPRRRGF